MIIELLVDPAEKKNVTTRNNALTIDLSEEEDLVDHWRDY